MALSKLKEKSLEKGFVLGKGHDNRIYRDFTVDTDNGSTVDPNDEKIIQPGRKEYGKKNVHDWAPRHAVPEEDDRDYAKPKLTSVKDI